MADVKVLVRVVAMVIAKVAEIHAWEVANLTVPLVVLVIQDDTILLSQVINILWSNFL